LRLPKLRKKPKRARLLRRSVRTRKRRKMLRFGLDLNRAHSPLFINKIRFRTWKKRYTQGRAVAKKRKKKRKLKQKRRSLRRIKNKPFKKKRKLLFLF